ncbi:MAG: hypothetical protein Q7T82_04150 [Armatimonadota bacterium]|nr:hypothetical protein [Armatimonadota bacterium]
MSVFAGNSLDGLFVAAVMLTSGLALGILFDRLLRLVFARVLGEENE